MTWMEKTGRNKSGDTGTVKYDREFYELLMEQHEGNVGVCLQIMYEEEKCGAQDSGVARKCAMES